MTNDKWLTTNYEQLMTNLKDKWEAAFAQFPHQNDILKDIRQEALRFFVSNGFPSIRTLFSSLSNMNSLYKRDDLGSTSSPNK